MSTCSERRKTKILKQQQQVIELQNQGFLPRDKKFQPLEPYFYVFLAVKQNGKMEVELEKIFSIPSVKEEKCRKRPINADTLTINLEA